VQLDRMAHVDPIEEHVDLAAVVLVPKEQPPGAVNRVELLIWVVTALDQ
jgi:hypothetical protein